MTRSAPARTIACIVESAFCTTGFGIFWTVCTERPHPRVPSTIEAGLPDLQTIAWTALFAPKTTPQAVVERINAALDKAMRDEPTAKRMAELGADLPPPDQRTPQALGALVRSEIDKWVP